MSASTSATPPVTPPGRLLVLGLDSADAEHIERWCDQGHLPTLARLRAEGVWSRLGTTAEVLHVSGWASLYTGATPAHHGLYHAYQVRAGEQQVHRTRAAECALPPFWKHLDDAGRRCIVVDAFMTTPVAGFRGVEVLEYGTWTWFDEPRANPSGLWKEIQQRFGPYPAPEHTNVLVQPEPARFRDQLMAGAATKGKLLAWLLGERDWDVCFAMFGEPHPAGHYLWHVSDPDYPTFPGHGPLEHAVRDVYAAVDAAIGEVLGAVASLGEDVRVLVVSGDGMGPNYAGCHLLPEVLHRLDLYHGPDVGRATSRELEGELEAEAAAAPASRRGLARRLRDLVPVGMRRSISRCLPTALQHRLSMKWANADIDWSRTRAFCVPNANEGYVRLNLTGREPRGLVSAGEAAEILATITARARALEGSVPGERAVREAWDLERVFPGPLRANLPDLSLTWNAAARTLDTLRSSELGWVRGATPYDTAPFYSGNHRPNAFLLAHGPGLARGAELSRAHVLDLAPTICAWQGVPSPPHHTGRVLTELVR